MVDETEKAPDPTPIQQSSIGSNPSDALTLRRIELSAAPIGRMINIISLIAGIIALTVIGAVVAIAILGGTIPEQLSNWGGIILGFYFGQFINLVKDYTGILQNAVGSQK
jgi:hypothetical protein